MAGELHLFPCPIAEETNHQFSDFLLNEIKSCRYFITERARTTRRWLSSLKFPVAIQELNILEMDKNNPGSQTDQMLAWLQEGKKLALLSEAGTPCIADPGNLYVMAAQREEYKVIPYVGPNSLLLALMASGLNGQRFTFHGYLPIKDDALRKKLNQLEKRVLQEKETQIWIETPYRNDRMLKALVKHLKPSIFLCVATEINGKEESIITKKISDWKNSRIEIGKKNTVFLIG